jgi:hypothetical protein
MNPETELCKLAAYYGSDRTPCLGGHAYTPYYFGLFKGLKPKKILEIGIDTGRGLRMWRDYFPEAEIFGLDGDPSLLFDEFRIKTFPCDLGNVDSIIRASDYVGAGIDIAFDDGSHVPQHQVDAARIFMPFMSLGGIYIIEDVRFPNYVMDNLPEFKKEVVEFHVNNPSLDDDRLVVIHA